MRFILHRKRQSKNRLKTPIKFLTIVCFVLFFTGCGYPTAFLFNKEALPDTFGDIWVPKKRSVRSASRIQFVEPVDMNILKGPLSLSQVVDFSLKNNPATAMSWASILGAIAELGEARKEYWPKAKVSSNIQRQRQASPFSIQAKASQWLTLGVTDGHFEYTLWDFGARFAKSETALQALYAMSYSYNQDLQNTIQLVTNNYYSYLYQKAAYCDRARDVEDAALLLQAAEKKLHLGIANVTDLVQAKTVFSGAQVSYITQKDFKENALATLASNMGMAANLKFETQDFPQNLPGREFLLSSDEFIEIALNNRPEIVQYKAEVLSKKAALQHSRLDPLPKIKGDLDLQYQAFNGFRNSFNLAALFKVEMPIFEGFYFRNKIRQAKADLKIAEANFKQQQNMVLQEVTLYYQNYKNAVDKIEYTQDYLDAAAEEFQVTLANYKAGTGDILDVSQAWTSLSDARTKFTRSVKELFTSLTNLAYATGSLLAPSHSSNWEEIYQFEDSQ